MNASGDTEDTKNSKYNYLKQLYRRCYSGRANDSSFDPRQTREDELWCPRTFDGFTCWADTPEDTTAYQLCPGFVVGFDPERYVYKRCTADGTWDIHPEAKKPWTNYTTCVDLEDLDFRYVVNNIYVVGYAISAVALLISLGVFLFFFRTLHCNRIRIHIHLFTAFTLNNIFWILWYKTVVNTVTVLQANELWCQLLHIITNYFMVTSYFWMFCEALHLHITLVVVFVRSDLRMSWFIALGWGLSLVVVVMYAIARHITEATERCWTVDSEMFYIIVVPVCISLIASLVFLINVLRVLLTQLHPTPIRNATTAKRAARAALLLIPLFGLHYVLIPLRPHPNAPGEYVYQVVSALLTSLQGFCVAVLFCFTNQEVKSTIKTYIIRLMINVDATPMTGLTGGESMMHTRENVV